MFDKIATVLLIVLCSSYLRWATSTHSYSGHNKPPMYGDYEAQRHWQEITVNLQSAMWYTNTTNNNLTYWGLDYPPLTAYHSYLNGKIAEIINPEFVALKTSHGYQSSSHKFFMRATVLVADLVVFFPSVAFYYFTVHGRHSSPSKTKNIVTGTAHLLAICLYPGFILIDHGHFQYNSISLGLTILAITAIIKQKYNLSAFSFTLALNYKQMSLYHSLPFFFYLLSQCFPPTSKKPISICLLTFLQLGLTVVITFTILWLPYLQPDAAAQVVHRLFPLARGVFEDKVGNIWCAVNVLYKLKTILSDVAMAKVCLVTTACVVLPSQINLFFKPSVEKFVLSLIVSSLGFFLFSFHVHEKTILLVATPVLIYFPKSSFACFWFLLISSFSMLPLLIKDHLVLPLISLITIYYIIVHYFVKFEQKSKLNLLYNLSLLGCVVLFLSSVIVPPPTRYPDLWPLLVSLYSCGHFVMFFVYFNYKQMCL